MDRGVKVLDLNDIVDASHDPTEKALIYCLCGKQYRKFLSIGNESSLDLCYVLNSYPPPPPRLG